MANPAVRGVIGRILDLADIGDTGNGKEGDECVPSARYTSSCGRRRFSEPGFLESMADSVKVEDVDLDLFFSASGCWSDKVDDLVVSLGMRSFPPLLLVVLLRAILCVFCVVSIVMSSPELDFRACARAKRPAQRERAGTATPARTKLAKAITGCTFSAIFSGRDGSPKLKTTCCTLLYILLQVLKVMDCGFDARSCRYV